VKTRKLLRKLPLALVPLTLVGVPGTASAGPNDTSTDRPWSLQFGIGPAVHFGGAAHGRFGFDFQYHFFGGDVGPALGAQAFTLFRARSFGMNIGPMFLWDFRIVDSGNFKLYIAPLVALGHGFWHWSHRGRRRDPWTRHYFFMDFGAQLKGMWNDRIGFFVRPANFSVWVPFAHGYWSFISGLSLSF
jgi:hypothetical protein